ncbi:MAG: hypothetical protein IEMM0008_0101 [bacterium]|nr:MAG: hypothetical protein IEMM0008_0101 [bacterium]
MRFTLVFVIIMAFTVQLSFAKGKGNVLSGGNTKPKYVIGLNFVGGHFNGGAEVEFDIGLSKGFSIAPRLGLNDFNFFSPGVSFRFGIIKGKRPHGFWVGPSVDFIFFNSRYTGNRSRVVITPAAEFGWRYTFDFNLSLQALTRMGFYTGYGSGFFWVLGVGVGYAFG